jgi:hypothetical protein
LPFLQFSERIGTFADGFVDALPAEYGVAEKVGAIRMVLWFPIDDGIERLELSIAGEDWIEEGAGAVRKTDSNLQKYDGCFHSVSPGEKYRPGVPHPIYVTRTVTEVLSY